MPLTSSAKPSAIGATSVAILVAYSEYCPVVGRRQIGWCPDPMPLGSELSWRLGTRSGCGLRLRNFLLLVDHVLEGKMKRESGGKERDQWKSKKEGRDEVVNCPVCSNR